MENEFPEGTFHVEEFLLRVCFIGSPENYTAQVHLLTAKEEPTFEAFMCAAEYLMACTARESNAGYEKALELLVKGALTYEHIRKPNKGKCADHHNPPAQPWNDE